MTYAKTRDWAGLLPVLMLASATVISLSVHFSMPPVALSPAADAMIVGGRNYCGIAEGVVVGLGFAGIFGCFFCGVAAVVIGAVALFAC